MHLLKYFTYDHLPDHLASLSKLFHDMAHNLAATLPGDRRLHLVTYCIFENAIKDNKDNICTNNKRPTSLLLH